MSQHPKFAIFRKFNKLNLQTLLCLLAETTYLEDDLKILVICDFADTVQKHYARDWRSLAASNDPGDDREQWEKVLAIRQKAQRL